MAGSHLVVDGSNIATEGRSLPSLRQLDEAVRAFLAERPHDVCTVVVDATFEHRIDASEKKTYDEAVAANELLSPPAGSVGRGDKFLLEIAERADATVFSNDSFQEFHGDYDWLFQPGRLIGGKPVPGVGWVFVERTPVRGPKSRQATRAASKKRAAKVTQPASGEPAAKRRADDGRRAKRIEVPSKATSASAPSSTSGRGRSKAVSKPASKPESKPAATNEPAARKAARPLPALNEPLPFIEFVARHQTGSLVSGTVAEFSSHGAYVEIDGVRCYAPLRLLGDPAPRSVREVLTRGEQREFVVVAINAARRGIDVGLPGLASSTGAKTDTATRATRRSASSPGKTGAVGRHAAPDQAPGAPGAEQPESEATLAPTKKASARKAPARKTTARKAPARKTTARKTTARKSTARKSTARKSTAKKSTAKKTTARKSTARKSPAKRKSAAGRTLAKKSAPAKRKSTAAKTLAKKSTARKSTARKSPAKRKSAAGRTLAKKSAPAKRKSTAAKTLAKKSTARKSTARKTTARKSTARKSTARKSTARKSTARKSPARKTTARKTTARRSTAKRATKRTTKR